VFEKMGNNNKDCVARRYRRAESRCAISNPSLTPTLTIFLTPS